MCGLCYRGGGASGGAGGGGSGGICLPKVKAAAAGRLCCSDQTEISRRSVKVCPHKDRTERYETREQEG